MPLTDVAVRNAKPGDKARKMADGGGLYLEVRPTGAKWWRLRYRFDGLQKLRLLGVHPAGSWRPSMLSSCLCN